MLALYLAALILGLGGLLIQLSASSEGGQPGAPVLGSPPGGGAGPLAHGGPDAIVHDASAAHGTHHLDGTGGVFSSLRFYLFAALGFGAVGTPVTAFAVASSGVVLAVALATGLVVGWLAALGFRALGRQTLSSNVEASELRGQVGRVLVACEKGRKGKVRLTVRGQIVDIVATTDERRLELGDGVIVEEVGAGYVHVCRAPNELLPR
jgi:membrane protein implicated in regulation of membrane protease activity